jgi:hypothetical protein
MMNSQQLKCMDPAQAPLSCLLVKALPSLATPLLARELDVDFLRLALMEQEVELLGEKIPLPPFSKGEKTGFGRVFDVVVDTASEGGEHNARVRHGHLMREPHASMPRLEAYLAQKAWVIDGEPDHATTIQTSINDAKRYADYSRDLNPVYFSDDFARMNGFAKSVLPPHYLFAYLESTLLSHVQTLGLTIKKITSQIGAEAFVGPQLKFACQKQKGHDAFVATLHQNQKLVLNALCQVVKG